MYYFSRLSFVFVRFLAIVIVKCHSTHMITYMKNERPTSALLDDILTLNSSKLCDYLGRKYTIYLTDTVLPS